MKIFDLPTYPIADAMHLGKRPLEEYQWLIDRGVFTFWNNKLLITKQNGKYQLYRNNAPAPDFESEAPTLDALIKDHGLPISQFQWHPHWIDNNEPVYPLQAEDGIPTTDELETLARIQEVESA